MSTQPDPPGKQPLIFATPAGGKARWRSKDAEDKGLAFQSGTYSLREQIVQLQHIADNVDVIISQCSHDLRYTFVNRSCAAFLRRPVHEIVGQEISEVIGVPAFEKIRPYIDKVLAGEVVDYETEIPYAGAGPRWMRVVYSPDFDEEGKVHGWVAAITDISERRRADEALKEADHRKDEFLAMLAHELRNPLAALSSSFTLMVACSAWRAKCRVTICIKSLKNWSMMLRASRRSITSSKCAIHGSGN